MEDTVGQRIRARRTELGFSMRQAAGSVGVTHQQWTKWESNENRVGADRLTAIAQTLRISADALLGLESGQSDQPTAEDLALDEQARKLMRYFRELSPPDRSQLLRGARIMVLEARPLPA